MPSSRDRKLSFGDFQTPAWFAAEVCQLLQDRGLGDRGREPRTIFEPTCGKGSLLFAAADAFPNAERLHGADINSEHLAAARQQASARPDGQRFAWDQVDFFQTDWSRSLAASPEPLLVLGNPPWVTNARQGVLASSNLPSKTNAENRRGIDAITGSSNFDVSEWILSRLIDAIQDRTATLAMLCKTAVARRVLAYAWGRNYGVQRAEWHAIDARRIFQATVAACVLVIECGPGRRSMPAAEGFPLSERLGSQPPVDQLGWHDGQLIANLPAFLRRSHLQARPCGPATTTGDAAPPVWRSGIKHDCSAVMELTLKHGRWRNGLNEFVNVEPEFVYPLLKSGDIASGPPRTPHRWLIVPQQFVGQETADLARRAPRLNAYLQRHAERLDARRSSIYRGRPRYSVFGVGPYSFAPWKVVVSGLAKELRFAITGPCEGRPWVLDDTGYFLPCDSEERARRWWALLDTPAAREFFQSFLFWDAKRPVTAQLLRRLDLNRLAREEAGDTVLGTFGDGAPPERSPGSG